MFTNVSFFVLLKNEDGGASVKRLKLERKAQIRLTDMFIKATKELLERERIPFDGSYKPDEGEAHQIAGFPIPPDVTAALREPTSVEELTVDNSLLPKINAIFTGISQPALISFQKFGANQYITSKGLSLFHTNNTFELLDSFGINIPERVDCVFSLDTLLFGSFYTARQIFDLSAHYREATDADVAEFAGSPQVLVEDPRAFYGQADSWVRRKIAMIKDSNYLQKYTPRQICEKAAEYGVEIGFTADGGTERLLIPQDKKKMKDTLRFLDEEIYKGPFSDTTYLTNSKKRYV
ncbi:Kiwa anti-phage protein KwaB-like domain-containing protein [Paenibacillus thermotolerans]|uniref:Kiwa anti-phage protein KwaB-like domain-containing protein n=1 Tax=Paenibacillus thermotolerans TaxID=3027807 RepID=UPI002367899B|nr:MULTISPECIES: Kiwa anti-phage protein KwaB-like domain-containing protein [unclassified Paenibacillus]